MRFFVGVHHLGIAKHVKHAFISINVLKSRRSAFEVGEWVMDSGAFTDVTKHGGFRLTVSDYAAEIRRWSTNGKLLAAVSQDYMCEDFVLKKTGKTIEEHQRMTIERYDDLLLEDTGGVYVMPVLQGYSPENYASHVRQYGSRLSPGAWVGVGSVCKRNSNAKSVEDVLRAIKAERPDLRLHGFGLKTTALENPAVRDMLETSDSMAWSFAARRRGRDANSAGEAIMFEKKIESIIAGQPSAFGLTWQQRIDNYTRETKFPRSLFVGEDGRVVGTWIMGNDYRVRSGYYGGYPAGYLKRIAALFPDRGRVLHLFSGRVDVGVLPGDTVDCSAELRPTYVDDAQTLEKVPLACYRLILADPPYSVEDAEHYAVSMVKRNLVMDALGRRLLPGAFVVWLDQVLPMYRKSDFSVEAVIGMVKSTNHRFRVVTVFRKL